MAKKKQPANLYYKGKRLNKSFQEAVIHVAKIGKHNVSTPAKLKKFYEGHKDKFAKLFEIGLETQLKGSTTIFNQFDKAEENEHDFFIETPKGVKPITAKNAKFELSKLEQKLNVMFESTGVEYSYKKKLDNSVIIAMPSESDLEDIQDEPVEFINDFLSDYGIKIYTSDPGKRKKYKENEPKRKSYSETVTKRFKKFRKEHNKEKREQAARTTKRKQPKKATKTKTKKRKR